MPTSLAESLMSGVNALAVPTPVCLPTVPVTTAPPGQESHGHSEWHHEHDGHQGERD